MNVHKVSLPKACSEPWDDMLPNGRGRFCDQCERTVHDLSRMTVREVDRLIESEPEPCVRAEICANNSVKMKEGARSSRRFIASVGSAAALLVSGCQTVPQPSERGSIVGFVDRAGTAIVVTALGADGTRHRTKVKSDGRYRIRNLPFGAYSLNFVSDCGNGWTGDAVIVRSEENEAVTTSDTSSCIYIGMLKVDDRAG